MRSTRVLSALAGILMLIAYISLPPATAASASLRGSPASMQQQHQIAKQNGFTFAATPADVKALVEKEELVPVEGNAHYSVLESVSFPYARPELRLFIERLAEQYHEDTGEKLVVTSLTRPVEDQPWNSHPLSVHPAGMAVDLRVSDRTASQRWLNAVLLKLERQGLLDVTRETRPPHYHVALFPDAYREHVEELIGPQALTAALLWRKPEPEEKPAVEPLQPAPAEAQAVQPAAEQPAERSAGRRSAALPLLFTLVGGIGYGIGYWHAKRLRRAAAE